MKRSLAGALGFLALMVAGTATADISRDSQGGFILKNATFTAEDGTLLGTNNIVMNFHYVTAIGRYGGGDTASGRMKAKNRATTKTWGCMAAFFSFGLLGRVNNVSPWARDCGRDQQDSTRIVDPDITLRDNWWAYFTIEGITAQVYCERARQLAQQRGKTGPVTVTGQVAQFSDAAGSEADFGSELGSHVTTCY